MSSADIKNETKDNESIFVNNDEASPDELVDPRVQIELERLNTATDAINKLEIELDEARANFRLLLSESSVRVNQLANKLGACVEKARPYYEARMHAKQVNEAESERVLSQHEHQKTSLAYNEAEKIVQHLHQELRKSIVKSSLSTRRSLLQLNNLANQHQLQLLPYFEMKAQFNQLLEEQRKKVHHLEEKILKMKMSYADALHNLEEISDEIHQKRKSVDSRLYVEGNQIEGAESPLLSCDSMKLTYHKLKSSDISSNNISMENLNIEDMYKSLPSKITPRPGIIAASCIGANSQKVSVYPASLTESQEVSKDQTRNVSVASEKSEIKLNKMNSILDKKQVSQSSSCSSPAPDHLEQLSTANRGILDETKSNGLDDVSLNGEEIPDCKFLSPDFSALRIHREEVSDSESLASTDTTDTLDDNQIECLLLEKVYPLEIEEPDNEKISDNSKSDNNTHL
ncbi:SH3 domain-binding protein 5-like isoform X4 [Argiope bruennichi]|uniref:SH3 domain-binding protein 5-like isoform X4 n=1 Tax=Argiope bruennichi TaxID=94029 RepID=UPI0024951E2D|nr:SH3 domain-binding protein 5-like isoform X4 [Argiope bruennichi]